VFSIKGRKGKQTRRRWKQELIRWNCLCTEKNYEKKSDRQKRREDLKREE